MEGDGCPLADTYLGRKSSCFECPFYPEYDDCIAYLGMQVFKCFLRRKKAKELQGKGYTVKQIADELGVTEHTINRYKRVGLARPIETTTAID